MMKRLVLIALLLASPNALAQELTQYTAVRVQKANELSPCRFQLTLIQSPLTWISDLLPVRFRFASGLLPVRSAPFVWC